jgi:hypothetical protein
VIATRPHSCNAGPQGRRAASGGAVDILPRVFPSRRRVVASSCWPAAGAVDSEGSVTVKAARPMIDLLKETL